jgi:hypothetical protein
MCTTLEIWSESIICRFVLSPLHRALGADRKNQKYQGFEFLEPLVNDMVQDDPTKRPTMDDVVTRFSEIKNKLSTWKLRSRIARKDEIWLVTACKAVRHWYWTVGYLLGRKAAIPEPK